ncbi:MAG: N-6 DNA methylase [Bacteroidales bacterium]|nr:N-6 DNA methylase [Bacteroidales bacterium]
MNNKKLIQTLGFLPKENTSGIFQKKYNGYAIEVDFENSVFNFGNKIKWESKTTQNFSQAENWVVLECVDRLLEKGYQPQNITLEKTWKTGHGTSGRLDIYVSKDDGTAYLMIECKTWGSEYEKEFKNLERNGGQLFTYFQQDKNADVLMLYTSKLEGEKIEYKNTIVKIEEDYRQTGNVKDFYERWNKLPKTNGIFENWVKPYGFQSKALTRNDLKILKQKDSSFIFNRFLEILRHNVVSDKPNAFNKIFTLFLCKIIDEDRNIDEQLHFQWLEGEDNHISFQKRLTDLYNKGMRELLEKKVTDISDDELDRRFQQVDAKYKEEFRNILTEIRLKKNNEFAIKEVFDDASFEENAKVVKEVVELLQVYQIRYNYRQQFLSDFFELLLTTGLKQESGQFFTPVPIARFIIKSLPIQEITLEKIKQGNTNDLLPRVIDYAAGSGHFITESMEILQKYIEKLDVSQLTPTTKRAIKKWEEDPFDWADDYVYAIEKDYRLVKTAKVSCYLHGDGLAKVIHGDGLGDFKTSKDFKDLLKETDRTYPQDNKQFDVVISNPPYSVSAFKGTMMDEKKAKRAFDLYSRLTDQSSEIECLFVERTKQLLKDGGVAGIILPSSILSNAGIYTQTREIILKYFDILGIVELGSNTFMATGTNTVTLFLKRRNNADAYNVEESVKRSFTTLQDVVINGIEKPISKYINHVWENISFEDYKTLLQKTPNENIEKHEIYKEYTKKIKAKENAELWTNILAIEQEKLLYFILAYPQKLVLVKTGQRAEEKRFLGYEFSKRRGSEGIHPIQRSKSIDECTHLYDAEIFDNPKKASTYIYKAFLGEFNLEISENLQKNISYQNLVDMFTFDRVDFVKNISLTAKKKVRIESKWELKKMAQLVSIVRGASPRPIKEYITDEIDGHNWIKIGDVKVGSKFITETKEKITKAGAEKSRLVKKGDFILSNSMSFGRPYIMGIEGYIHDGWLLFSDFAKELNKNYFFYMLSDKIVQEQFVIAASGGTSVDNLNIDKVSHTLIPLPPLDIQQKIVSEIEILEVKEQKASEDIENLKNHIESSLLALYKKAKENIRLSSSSFEVRIGRRVLRRELIEDGTIPVYSANVFEPFGYVNKELLTDYTLPYVVWGIDGDWMVNIIPAKTPFYPTDHCGYMRVLNPIIEVKYLAFALESEGQKIGFSRNFRASIDRIEGITIPLPSLVEQQKVVSEIEKIEVQISELENQIAEIPKQKEQVLKKYLN